MKKQRRKICFVITSYIHYSRNLLILEELNRRDDVDLSVVLGGTALIAKYASKHGTVRDLLKSEGCNKIYEIHFNLEGDSTVVKAKTAGLGVVEFATLFNNIKPDLIIVRGDRFEVLSAALAAAYMNIAIAHIEGGDISGTIDESVRHAISKLAHLHFATNEDSYKRLLRMGENKRYVYMVGSPDVEVASKLAHPKSPIPDLKNTGSGAPFDLSGDFLMVMYHPVWTYSNDLKLLSRRTKILLETIHEMRLPTLWFWPNSDVGAEEIAHELRRFDDQVKNHQIRFMRYVPPRIFLSLLSKTKCLVGNSSAGIKECSYLGVPVVNVGDRQFSRLRAHNVVDVPYDKEKIKAMLVRQIKKERYEPAAVYFQKNTSKTIARIAATAPLYVQKSFHE